MNKPINYNNGLEQFLDDLWNKKFYKNAFVGVDRIKVAQAYIQVLKEEFSIREYQILAMRYGFENGGKMEKHINVGKAFSYNHTNNTITTLLSKARSIEYVKAAQTKLKLIDEKLIPKKEDIYFLQKEFGFSDLTFNNLARAGIFTIEDLLSYSKEELLSIRNLGVGKLQEIEEKLAAKGYYLKGEQEDVIEKL